MKMDNFDVSFGDCILYRGEKLFVYGGDRSDHYEHYVKINGKEVNVNSLIVSEVEIVKSTCYLIKAGGERIYEHDEVVVKKRGDETYKKQIAKTVYTKTYPYFYFEVENGVLEPMNKYDWFSIIESRIYTYLPLGK